MTARLIQSCKWVLGAMVALFIAAEALPARVGERVGLVFLICWLTSFPLGVTAFIFARRSVTEVLTWPVVLLGTSTAVLIYCIIFARTLIL